MLIVPIAMLWLALPLKKELNVTADALTVAAPQTAVIV